MLSKALFVFGALSEVADASSIGDRYVLQVHFNKTYQQLPLTIDAAQTAGWKVSDDCVPGLGRKGQTSNSFFDAPHGALHLWYDQMGSVMGFGVTAASESGAAAPWKQVVVDGVIDHWEIDFVTRDPSAACRDGPAAEEGSVGDRLWMVGDNESDYTAIPTTLQGAFDAKYNDGGPCFPNMGWHMMLNRYEVSSPTPVYNGGDGSLVAMNLNSYATQQTPSWDFPAPKEGKPVYGWHVYFKEHDNACVGTADGGDHTAYAAPFANTPAEHLDDEYTDFHCTPYFGQLWVQTIATVVDLHATGSVCQDADGDCKFVHYSGPTAEFGYSTPCVPPAPTDGCHCYHQVTYTGKCYDQITTSPIAVSGTLDTSDAFDENGVLRVCSEDVVDNVVVGWAPPAETPTPCDCEGVATLQV